MTLLLMIPLFTVAQATDHEVEVRWGTQTLLRDDALLSPVPYRGITPVAAGLGYTAAGSGVTHDVDLSVTLGQMRSGPAYEYMSWPDGEVRTTQASPITLVDVRYAFGVEVADGKSWNLRVGATNHNHIEQGYWVYGRYATSTYFGALSVGPWARLHLEPGTRQRVDIDAWTPVLGWVARSPYALNDAEFIYINRNHSFTESFVGLVGDGQVQTVDKLQGAHLRVSYQVDLSDLWSVTATGRADLVHNTTPKPMAQGQFGLDVGVAARF